MAETTKEESASSSTFAEAHVQRTLDLLAHERDTDLAQTSLLVSKCSPKLLESRGLAILNLQVTSLSVGLGGKTLVELGRWMKGPLPAHSFRNGDTCEILGNDAGNGKAVKGKGKEKEVSEASKIQGVVYRTHEDKIVIALDSKEKDDKDPDIPEKCRIQKLANTVTYERMEKTLQRLLRTLNPSATAPSDLIQVLFNMRQPGFTKLTQEKSDSIVFLDENLNDLQKDATKFAVYEADEIALIHGPPGTGKTSTLIECIRHLVALEKRVLVCAASNLAVDNILERLSAHLPAQSMSRLGHPARIMPSMMRSTLDYQTTKSDNGQITKEIKVEIEEWTKKLSNGKIRGQERREGYQEVKELRKEYRKREGTVIKGVVTNSKVILATCHGAGSRQLMNVDFDVLIIDEAAQALEAVCWIPILKTARKLILAGDHLQLPPTIKSNDTDLPEKLKKDKKTSPKSLEVTLFDRLLSMYGSKVKRLLSVQYRMNEKIMLFPSRELYDSKLVAHESVSKRLLTDLPALAESPAASSSEDDGLLTEPVVFYDTAGSAMYERAEDSDSDSSLRKTVDGESKSNENEADIVMRFIEELIAAGIPKDSISVITPYNAQVALIQGLIREKYPPDPLAEGAEKHTTSIECGSVDGFQGREKDVIVLSLVRSNDKKEVGFLSEKRRLNVAMTRAKRCLCIVGDSETVRNGGKFLKDWMDWLEENADVKVVQ